MKLLTAQIRKATPALYSQENNQDPVAKAKFFSIRSDHRWYMTKLDAATGKAFGLVTLNGEGELGYFDINELESLRAFGGRLPVVERDTSFTPTPLSEIRKKLA